MTIGSMVRTRLHAGWRGVEQLQAFLRRERSALTSVFVSNLLLALAGLVSGFVLARTLLPVGRGVLGSAQALPMLLAGFVLLGLQEAVVYHGVKQPERRRAYLSVSLALTVTIAVAVAALLALGPVPSVHRSGVHLAYVLVIVLTPLTQIPLYVLQASGRFLAWSVLRSTSTVAWLLIALTTLLVRDARSPSFVATSYLIALAALVPVFLWVGYRSTPPGPRPERADAVALLRFGLPMMMTGAPLILNLRLDIVVVTSRFDEARIGYYLAAVAWGALLVPAFNTLSVLALPLIARQERSEAAKTRRAILLLMFSLVVLVVAMTVPLTRLAFPRVFGAAYRPATNLASLALVAGAVQGSREIVAAILRGEGRLRVPLVAELAGLAVTLTTLWWFLDAFGPAGGQWSSLVAYSTTLIVMLVGVGGRKASPGQGEGMEVPRPSDPIG